MSNRLANESSPYLIQHAQNPVDWYAWNDEALARARSDSKPIFLSIGYSACHWCHVMEHESFEDEHIAKLLNDSFVCIKVDREERPDLDQIYMQAVQILSGRGGWPMSVFLTPDLHPFFGGTYWPPQRRHGMPGFDEVVNAVLDAWTNRRKQAIEQATNLTERIRSSVPSNDKQSIDLSLLAGAAARICSQFDGTNGGFGPAPKFPHSMTVQFLLRMWSRDRDRNAHLLNVATTTLDRMAAGGIYDHLSGGFARYSVDARWLVPHFEKMLYDNALLVDVYLDAFTATGMDHYGQVAEEICGYIIKYMTDDAGGFHSTEDADSEGVEGKFYVWTVDEVKQVLGEELAEKFCYVYDITEAGNFEGKNIPNLSKTLEQCADVKQWNIDELRSEMTDAKTKLLAARDTRIRPAKDDKVLTSWNGLMIHAMARAGAILDHDEFRAAAIAAAEFVLRSMRRENGCLLHTWRHGQPKLAAYLDDYANFANALVTLYETTFEDRWIDAAVELGDIMLERFTDPDGGGFFYTADDHEALIARMKDVQDSSTPSGNAMAATVLQRLGHLCNRNDFLDAAHNTLRTAVQLMDEFPLAVGQMLIAADFFLGPVKQIVIAEAGETNHARSLRQRYLPHAVVAGLSNSTNLLGLVKDKTTHGTKPRLFVCERFTCQQPIEGEQIATVISEL
jgi:uncharacterized protein YyaL (SSP411 family)